MALPNTVTPVSQPTSNSRIYGPYRGKDGRCRVVHYDGSRTWSESHARYVWRKLVGPIPEGYDVDHIDGDRTNDDPSNLQLLSKQENRRKHHRQHPGQARAAGLRSAELRASGG